jgi:cellobiose PTS system EIIC component
MKHLQYFSEWTIKLNHRISDNKSYQAIMRTFSTLFPFVLLGAFMKYIHRTVFTEDGFLVNIYHMQEWVPFYREIGTMLNVLELVTIGTTALVATLFAGNDLAKSLHDDADIVGICCLLVTFLLNFNYNILDNSVNDNRNLLYFNSFGFRYVFIGIITGLVVAYFYHALVWIRNHIWRTHLHDKNLVSRGVRSIFPVVIILFVATLVGYSLNESPQKYLTNFFSNLINIPVEKFNHSIFFIYFITIVNCFLSFIGLSNTLPNLLVVTDGAAGSANLNYALTHKNLFKVPNPITMHTMYEAYGNFGGTGMTLGLIIAILIFSHQRNLRQVAIFSLIPVTLGSLNSPLMVGIPIIFNPILLIPFLVSPIVSMSIAWVFINLKWMPPAVYGVPSTTPSFLQGFLGTNGNWMALVVSLLCIISSVAVYYPFLKLLDRSHHTLAGKQEWRD